MSRSPQNPKRPQQSRGLKRYQQILDVTEEMLVNQGYDAINTNAIAEQAGISIGTLYHYFADKASILTALLKRTYKEYESVLERTHCKLDLQCSAESYVESIFNAYEAFELSRKNKVSFTAPMSRTLLAIPGIEEIDQEYKDRCIEILAAYYQRRQPELPVIKTQMIATVSLLVLDGIATVSIRDEEAFYTEVYTLMISYFSLYFN